VVAKRRTGDPWQTPPEYGATLAGASLNLIVRDVERSHAFYVKVLRFHALYSDADFAALEWGGLKLQLHADHTWEQMPWHPRLAAGEPRGWAPRSACSAPTRTRPRSGRARSAPP
jgi:catechol 2,3-dioxygenase-like lactoylglutathione lyase family enzyme